MKKDNYIMGKNCIEEVLKHFSSKLLKVYTSQSNNQLVSKLKEKNIPIEFVDKKKLFSLVGSKSHQSFVAQVKERNYLDIKSFLNWQKGKKEIFLLMLDSIIDPQNFGAIIRVAECFGVDGIVWSKNRGAKISPVVAKASCGAIELIRLIEVSNLVDSLVKLKQEGFEIVVSDVGESCENIEHFTFSPKTVLVMGSEGKGVQSLIKKYSDYRICIPLQGKIKFLNVSQATSIFLYHWKRDTIRVI